MCATLSSHMPQVNPIVSLERLVRDAGSQRAAAAALDIGASYLSDLLRGRRECSALILKKLHLRRVVVREHRRGFGVTRLVTR